MERKNLLRFDPHLLYLDNGCGDALFLWGERPPQNVICGDIDVYVHSHVQYDANFLPFRDKAFDYVILFEVLEHVDDVKQVLAESLRVARNAVFVSYPGEDREMFKRDFEHYTDFMKKHGLKEMNENVRTMDRMPISHQHWKDKKRIEEDVQAITKMCGKPVKLNYGSYGGWGWVCLANYSTTRD